MDPATVAEAVVVIIRPFLRAFVTGSAPIAEGAGGQTLDTAKSLARDVWDRLQPRVQETAAASEAAEDAAEHPHEEDAASALRWQIRMILEEDLELARGLAGVLEQARKAGIIVIIGEVVIPGTKLPAPGTGEAEGTHVVSLPGDAPRRPPGPAPTPPKPWDD
jgi:hypothetical protein